MNTSMSFLDTVLDRVRFYLDEPDVDAKYNNNYIVLHCICPAMVDVMSRLNNTSQGQIILKYDLSLTTTDVRYKLPPCVQEIVRFVVTDQDSNIILDIIPRDRMDYRGKNWSIEGYPGAMEFVLEGLVTGSTTAQVWYVSNGDVIPHKSTSGTLDAGLDTMTLGAATVGELDRRVGGYNGQVLRLIPAGPSGIVEERIIKRHYYEAPNWKVDTYLPFTNATSGGSKLYEIAPVGSQPLVNAIALWAAMQVGTARKITGAHMDRLRVAYVQAIKTIGDNLTGMQSRVPHHFVRATPDNPYAQTWGWNPVR